MPKLSKADKAAKVSATEARRRKEVALAETRELELAKRKGELLEAGAVKAVWAEQFARIKDRLLAIPDRLAEAIAGQPAATCREKLNDEIENALQSLSESPV